MDGAIMANFSFSIPDAIFDTHETISDWLIDNGSNCLLVYPQKYNECPNCYLDIDTGRSTTIYKAGGPIEFTNYTICPYCSGEGRLSAAEEETIKCRVYYNSKDFVGRGNITIDQDTVQIITYLSHLSKFERAEFLIVDSDISTSKQYKCQPLSAALPHGFRHNRYLIQFWTRTG